MGAPPAELFHETVLRRFFDFKQERWFWPLVATHRAWTVCLHEAGMVGDDDARALRDALDALAQAGPEAAEPYEPAFEYFYLHIERFLVGQVGEQVAGQLNLGRTRPEPLTRMTLRGDVLGLLHRLVDLRATLLQLAGQELETVLPGYTHCQHGQPTTLAHYLSALISHLERDPERLLTAYGRVNRCTLGCGALSGVGFPLNRGLAAELLGFDGIVENTYDAVASGDQKVEALAAAASALSVLGRVSQDFHQWCTIEYGMAQVDPGFASISSLMPQKRNSLVFEYVRARAAMVAGALSTVLGISHNTFFQDVEDVCIDVEPVLTEAFDSASRAVQLFDGVVATMRFDRERMLELARTGFSTVSALAEAIGEEAGLSYRTSHRIVALAIQRTLDDGGSHELSGAEIDDAAETVIGRPLGLSPEVIARALDPVDFVRTRSVEGSPSPDAVASMLEASTLLLERDQSAVEQAGERLGAADGRLTAALAAL
jgi:argininosuccinate lyase